MMEGNFSRGGGKKEEEKKKKKNHTEGTVEQTDTLPDCGHEGRQFRGR